MVRATRKTPTTAFKKRAISLPPDVDAAAEAAMRARGLSSFSSYVAEAIRRDVQAGDFDELLATIFRDEPPTAEERAWAKRALYG